MVPGLRSELRPSQCLDRAKYKHLMSLFDLFKKSDKPSSSSDRELAKLAKHLNSRLSQDLDRYDALEKLSNMGTRESARILLSRFRWNLDPSIRDQEEKATVVAGIAKAGKAALEPLREYSERAESLTWPIKALREVVSGPELEEELLAILRGFDTDYVRNPEPKVHLLQALEEFRTDQTRAVVEPFLGDVNEAVRFAAASCLFAINIETAAESLGAALADEESLRIKNRIAQGLAERKWRVPSAVEDQARISLPPGFSLRDGLIVGEARG